MKQSVSTSLFQSNSNVSTAGRILRCLSKPSIVAMPRPKSRNKKKKNEEMEREWLLLGEPASPRNTVMMDDEQDTSSLTTPAQSTNQDVEALQSPTTEAHQSDTDSDSSTDIDAVFDEYRQKIEVTTSGPSDKILRIPSVESWRVSLVMMILYFVGISLTIIGFIFQSFVVFGGGILGNFSPHTHKKPFSNFISFFSHLSVVVLFTLIMLFLPRYSHSETAPNVVFCSATILVESILLGSTLSISLPAIIAWLIAGKPLTIFSVISAKKNSGIDAPFFFAGVLIFTRCDTWFSLCLEQPIYINHIVPSTSVAPNSKSMIRLPRPPKGSIVSSRVHRHGQCR